MKNRNPMKALASLAIPSVLLVLASPGWTQPVQENTAWTHSPASYQLAQADPDSHKGPRRGQHTDFIKQLGLTPEQEQQFKTMMQQGKEQSRALHRQLQTKRQALMQYLQSPNATEAQARAMNAEMNDLQKRLSELRLKTWFAMRQNLTPEQLQKLKELKSREKMGTSGRGQDSQGQHGRFSPGGRGFVPSSRH